MYSFDLHLEHPSQWHPLLSAYPQRPLPHTSEHFCIQSVDPHITVHSPLFVINTTCSSCSCSSSLQSLPLATLAAVVIVAVVIVTFLILLSILISVPLRRSFS